MPEEEQRKSQPRQVAYIISVKDLLRGKYVTQEGWEPNFVKTAWGDKIGRVHLVGTIVDKRSSPDTLRIDDSTGTIDVRSFDPIPNLDTMQVGTIIRIIGRPRIFNDSIYINPEIVTIITDTKWIKLHQGILNHFNKNHPADEIEPPEEIKDTNIVTEEENEGDASILSMIDEMDNGNGADIPEIVEKIKKDFDDPGAVIDRLLLHGEIFEIKPGKVKVLK
jgi:RPA family protein